MPSVIDDARSESSERIGRYAAEAPTYTCHPSAPNTTAHAVRLQQLVR